MAITFPRDWPDELKIVGLSFFPSPMLETVRTRAGGKAAISMGTTLWRGRFETPPMHVDDAAWGIVRAWAATLIEGETFYAYDITREYPVNHTDGFEDLSSPAFDGECDLVDVEDSKIVTLGGLPAGLVLAHGDYIAFDYGATTKRALHLIVSAPEVLIHRSLGTNIGNMTGSGGLAAAFDGDTSQNFGSGASLAADSGYVGKTHDYRVARAVAYATDNEGFVQSEDGTVTLRLYGKTGAAPASSTDGTLLAEVTTTDANSAIVELVNTVDTVTVFNHRWVRVAKGGAVGVGVAECQFYGYGAVSSAGNAIFEVRPHVRLGWDQAPLATVYLHKPSAEMHLVPGTHQESVDVDRFGKISFEAEQRL